MAEYTRAWAEKHFELFTSKENAAITLTTIKNIRGISVKNLNRRTWEKRFFYFKWLWRSKKKKHLG